MHNIKTTIGIATMPGRESALEKSLLSIINQADEVHVYFNEFDRLPVFVKKLKCKHLKIFRSQDEIGNLYDFGGFYKLNKTEGYFISCDDDLIFPKNFVKNIVNQCKKYNNKNIVGYHGRIYSGKVISYYHGFTKMYHIKTDLYKDKYVHILAGCAMCFHTDTLKFDIRDINIKKYPRMKDIHIGILAQKNKIPCIVLAHKGNDFKILHNYNINNSIWHQEHRNDSKQVELFNSINWSFFHNNNEYNENGWYMTKDGGFWYGENKIGLDRVSKGKMRKIDISEVPIHLINDDKSKFEFKNIIHNL